MNDRAKGIQAIEYFHNYSKRMYPLTYTISIDELINIIDSRGKGSLAGLGLGIEITEMSDSDVRNAMEKLARQAQGKIPATNNAFNMALSDKLQEIDFMAIAEIAKMSAIDLAKHSSEIGEKVIKGTSGAFDLIGNAKFVIPIALIGYFGFKLYVSENLKSKREKA